MLGGQASGFRAHACKQAGSGGNDGNISEPLQNPTSVKSSTASGATHTTNNAYDLQLVFHLRGQSVGQPFSESIG